MKHQELQLDFDNLHILKNEYHVEIIKNLLHIKRFISIFYTHIEKGESFFRFIVNDELKGQSEYEIPCADFNYFKVIKTMFEPGKGLYLDNKSKDFLCLLKPKFDTFKFIDWIDEQSTEIIDDVLEKFDITSPRLHQVNPFDEDNPLKKEKDLEIFNYLGLNINDYIEE